MIYILDTCVISELIRPNPNHGVVTWIKNVEESALFLSVLTIGELKRGIAAMPVSAKKEAVQTFFDHQVLKRFAGRILPLDTGVMIIWGEMYARLVKGGHPLPVMDSLIAAMALYHRATIVTRNTNDFSASEVEIINPWTTT